jgi:CDP-6-deoxy-D-xylo-4-hexulose-3-dehydrase
MGSRRIDYAGSVHDEREIEACLEVLRGGPTAMRIGKNVKAMEAAVAELFGKRKGIMCNSGSSALYLALELVGAEPGDEIITSVLTFSTDIAPMVRAGLVPAFVDVTPNTYQIDIDRIEEMITPRTKAILTPNLIGNCPDWDVIREIADRHGLKVIEDSCDALGSTLRGTPTGTRADISVTSFALSHIITAMGTGGMVCLDDEELIDKCLMLRRWGRRSEVMLWGSLKGKKTNFFSEVDGLEYDDLFIFDEVGWNFEPSEVSAAFGRVQVEKLPINLARRQANFAIIDAHMSTYPDLFATPVQTPEVVTGWHMYPFVIRPESGINRAQFQQHMESNGVDTRMVWTGNALRQPAFRDVPSKRAPHGYPNADLIMEWGLILPLNHSIDDDGMAYMCEQVDSFISTLA